MTVNRKEFIKRACLSGACLCGAVPLVLAQSQTGGNQQQDQTQKNPNELQQEWISILLNSIDDRIPEDDLRVILKGCAISHYNKMNMDETLAPFKGKPDDFMAFLIKEWDWKIDYDKASGVILVDENKLNRCVCPMVDKTKGSTSPAICFCSEGFIERMFTEVFGKQVKGKVLNSVLRGDPTCRYQVILT